MSGVFVAKPQAKLVFVDRRYHLLFLRQAELAGEEGDEGPSVYLIPLWGLWDDAWVDPQILGSCQSSGSLKCNQYHQGLAALRRKHVSVHLARGKEGSHQEIRAECQNASITCAPSCIPAFYLMCACHRKSTRGDVSWKVSVPERRPAIAGGWVGRQAPRLRD